MDKVCTDGFLLMDKPAGVSTFQSLRMLRNYYKGCRVGFAGTLDPDATGLLIVGVGKATKLLRFFEKMEKCYEFKAVPGMTTDTYDTSGKILKQENPPNLTSTELSEYAHSFLGTIFQRPPVYSALKIKGKRACDRARSGEMVELKERKVQIKKIEILEKL